MNDFSVRITQREGDQVRSIDLDFFAKPQALVLPLVSAANAGDTNPRFSVADGIVTDHKTGLQWSQDDVTGKAAKHEKAVQACKDLRLGGFDDWTLPSREQLLTLVDDTKHDPCIDKAAFPSCKSEWYWTATPYAASPAGYAWVVGFSSGYPGYGYRYDGNRVRAVRVAARQ